MENELCRLCCKNEGTSFIFLEDTNGKLLSAKIMYCCSKINIEDGDGLPSYVCENCENELNACYQFVLKCEETDKQLRTQSFPRISQVIEIFEDVSDVETEVKSQSDDDTYENLHCDDVALEELRQDAAAVKFSDDDTTYENLHCDDVPLEELRQDAVAVKFKQSKVEHKLVEKRKSYKTRPKYRSRGVVKCAVCGRQFTNQSALDTHMRSHTNVYSFPCTLCDKKYKDSGNLKRHKNRIHSEHTQRNFICENCGKGFFTKSDVNVHMRTHTGETPYACTECSARFTQLGAMLRHKKRHSGEKDHLCATCSKGFCTKQQLKMHYAVHSTEKKFICLFCNTSFKYQSNLTKHKRLHSESHSFICDYCGRNFKFKGNLKLHINKQHSEKSGYCELCSRHAANLEAHMRRHTGERPLKCELCTSSFFELRALTRHINFKHTKTDKYKCEVKDCSMVFPSRPMLDFHIAKLHSTHIPFPCDRCTRAFYRKSDLTRHKIVTHKDRLA